MYLQLSLELIDMEQIFFRIVIIVKSIVFMWMTTDYFEYAFVIFPFQEQTFLSPYLDV